MYIVQKDQISLNFFKEIFTKIYLIRFFFWFFKTTIWSNWYAQFTKYFKAVRVLTLWVEKLGNYFPLFWRNFFFIIFPHFTLGWYCWLLVASQSLELSQTDGIKYLDSRILPLPPSLARARWPWSLSRLVLAATRDSRYILSSHTSSNTLNAATDTWYNVRVDL